MRVPTPRRGSRSTVANKTTITSGRNNMIMSPLQYAHTAYHPPMGHLIRQTKQTGPRAQISALPDAVSSPRAQSPPRPMPSPALGRFLRLARHRVRPSGDFSASPDAEFGLRWILCLARARPRPPTTPWIPRATTPPTVAHVKGWLVQHLGKTSASLE
jgi:hypothetical protein